MHGESWLLVGFLPEPKPLGSDSSRNEKTTYHRPPFLRLSSALAFLAASTSGANVFSGSAV